MSLGDERRDNQSDKRPANRADTLDVIAEEHPDAARPLVSTCPDGGELVRLRHDADESVERQHEDHPRPNAGGRGQREPIRLQRRLHSIQTTDYLPAKRNQHERQHDDQESLKEIRPRRRDEAADEAVEDEHHRHRDHDLVDAHASTRGLTDDLCCSLQHAAGIDDEEAHREHDVDGPHPRAVSILRELRHRRAPYATEDRGHDPVERRDEQVLPLKPDRRGAEGVDGSRERHRHFRVRPDAEALAHHEPRSEPALAEKVLAGLSHPVADDEADRRDDHEVSGEDEPVEGSDIHDFAALTISHPCRVLSASQAQVDYHFKSQRSR